MNTASKVLGVVGKVIDVGSVVHHLYHEDYRSAAIATVGILAGTAVAVAAGAAVVAVAPMALSAITLAAGAAIIGGLAAYGAAMIA